MKTEKFSCICEKEVINIADGKRLGYVQDIEIDVVTGRACALLIPEEMGKWNFFCKGECYRVPWHGVKQIGDDIILVEIDIAECIEEC